MLLGCGGSPVGQAPKHAAIVRVGRGPAVALAGGTPSDGATQLALYVDAGSRDGSAPYVAALAAELLAERVGRGARGQAFPDGLEVSTVCDDGVRACAKRLARGLALRAPSDAAIARVIGRLKNAERNARASDPARGADELAVRALWPEGAAAFLPLDLRAAASDKRTFDDVRAFVAGAFGPSRAFVAASGPVAFDEITRALQVAFENAPRANEARAARALPANEASAALLTGVDASAALSLALRASDVQTATRAANVLRDELLRSKLTRAVLGHATSLRGGGLAVVRVHAASGDFAALLSRAGYAVERMRVEGVGAAELPLPRDAPAAALRRLGLRFIAGAAPEPSEADVSLGVGVLVRGARADRVTEKDPDAALRESERARLAKALQAGATLARPELDGELGEQAVSAALSNHSRVAVHVLASDQVAIAVRLSAGAASDPPAQHGRAALLASAMTVACAGRSPAALRAELASLGATIEPAVTASSLGITLHARAEHARAAIGLAVECALWPSLARGDVTRARLELRERLGIAPRDAMLPRGGAELRAQVARLLSVERTPGALAPWGAMSTLASVDERALSELLERARRGPSTSVAIVGALGELSAEAAAMLAARRMTRLSSESAPAAKAPATSTPAPRAKASGKQPATAASALPPQAVEALLVWSAPCPNETAATDASLTTTQDAARAFAAAMSAALASADLHVPWLEGDCAAGVAWAALLVRGSTERIAAIQATATRAAALIAPKAALEAADHTARKRLGEADSLAGHAEALAEAPWAPARQPGTSGAAATAALISRLRAAPVRALPVD
jgi:predicted Zn-dependent peptidase